MFEASARCQPLFFQGGAELFLAAKVAGPDGNGQSVVGNCFDGKLDALRIANAVLESEEVMAATAFDPDQSVRDRLLGVFNFSNGTLGSFRNELPPHQMGTLANMPRLGVTGARWDGSVHNFSEAPEHYSAVHFHSDDLYDCGWSSDFTFTISETLKSGIYAAKVVNVEGAMDYVPFFVMPRKCASRRAAIALMLPTMTYLAYANERIDDNSQQFGFDVEKWVTQFEPDLGGYAKLCSHPEFGMSLYDFHKDGLGRHFSSWLRPMLNMRPKAAIWGMPADILIASWLEHCGFEFDVITDHALEFLDNQLESDAPFSLNIHYTAPHAPWGRENHPADIFDAHYKNTAFDSVPEEDIHINQLAKEGSAGSLGDTPENRREALSGYFTAIEEMDRNIGRLLDWLEENGLRENTLVVFNSDNGMNMGHHGIWATAHTLPTCSTPP